MTGFSSGMRRFRITIKNRAEASAGAFGRDSQGISWEPSGTFWAAVDWKKGMTGMHEGALDVYTVVMVRMEWTSKVNMRSRINWQGQDYQILPDTFHPDKQANTIQFHAQVVI